MNLIDAINNRRSIRRFTEDKVTDDDVKYILSAAGKSPSWANTQVWEFIVIRDREIISRVTETYSENNPARKCSQSADLLIAVCAKKGVSGCKEGKPGTKFNEWFMFDLGMAVQNLTLAAWDIGLGTVVVGFMDHDRCAEILGVPEDYELAAVMPVGKIEDPDKKGPKKREIGEYTHLNRFGTPYIQ